MARLSAKRGMLTEGGIEAVRSLMKKEKSTWPKTDLAEHLDGIERKDFCDVKKLRKRACQKRKIEFGKATCQFCPVGNIISASCAGFNQNIVIRL